MDKDAILQNARTARVRADVAYLSGILPDELDELLEDREFRIEFEQARIQYRDTLFERVLEKGNGTQFLDLWLRSLEHKYEARHPREVKDDTSEMPDEIILKLIDG